MSWTAIERSVWAAAAVGLAGSIAGWVLDPHAFALAWLSALVLVIGWPLGSLALIHIHALTGGQWGFAIRPQLAFGVATLAVILPAVIPLAFLAARIYPWMNPDAAKDLLNLWYLDPAFFYGRGVAYCIIWLLIGALTLMALRRADPQPMLYRLAPPSLILLMLTVTFAAVDSTLSLEPTFKSSIYGMTMAAEGVLFALSIAALGALLTAPVRPKLREDLGKLLLGFTIFWAYLEFMQFLIVWSSNLPAEASWYVHRITGVWAWIAGLIALLHFFIPFFVLLWPQMQRSRSVLVAMTSLLIISEIPRAWWLVLASSPDAFTWLALPATLAVGALAAGVYLRAPRLSLVPTTAGPSHA